MRLPRFWFPYYGWILMVVLGLTTILSYGTSQYLFGVLVVPMSETQQWDRTSLAGAYSGGLILAGLFGIPVGHLVDRWGARPIMTVGSIVGGGSLLGLAMVQTSTQFILWWTIGMGCAMAMTFYPVSFTVVTNWFEQKRGTALAILTLLGGLASPLCIPFASWMVEQVGWRNTLKLLGIVVLGVAVPLHAIFLRRHPEDLHLMPDGKTRKRGENAVQLPGLTLKEALSRPMLWILTFGLSCMMLGSTMMMVHQIPSMIERGHDALLAATIAGSLGLASLPGRVLFNVLSERLSSQFLLGGCALVLAIGMSAFILAPSPAWLFVSVSIYGMVFGGVSPLYASVLADHVGRRAYGSVFAFQGIVVALCAGSGTIAAGWLYTHLHSYTIAFWGCVGLFLVAAPGIFLASPPQRARTTQ